MQYEEAGFTGPYVGIRAKMRKVDVFIIAQILAGVDSDRQLLYKDHLASGDIVIIQFAGAPTPIPFRPSRILEDGQNVIYPFLVRESVIVYV